MVGVEPPRGEHAVAVLVDHKRRQIIMLAAVFKAVLIVRKNIDKVVTTVIAPRHGPLACAARVVIGVFTTAAIASFQVAAGVDHQAIAA